MKTGSQLSPKQYDGIAIISMAKKYDARGELLPINFQDLPFVPGRLFVVGNTPKDQTRGEHSHLTQTQLLVCLSGKIEVSTKHGAQKHVINLDRNDKGLVIYPGTWSSQKFIVPGSQLLVLISGEYDPKDYAS